MGRDKVSTWNLILLFVIVFALTMLQSKTADKLGG